MPAYPAQPRAAVIGGGTMGADVAAVFARAQCPVAIVEPAEARRESLPAYLRAALGDFAHLAELVTLVSELDMVDWRGIDLVVECAPERLDVKQALFARLEELAPADAVLASNSSSFPIGRIAAGLRTAQRMYGLHFFMPAHLVPLVEVVMGPASLPGGAQQLAEFMRRCGRVPVLVRKDLPGFLANRLQHALSREAFNLIDEGVASPEDVDAAVRFGFGFRFLAAGPVMQRDHGGLDIHSAAGATIYPSLSNTDRPAEALRSRVDAGRTGMKSGAGFYDWTPASMQAERARYDAILHGALRLLEDELPPVQPGPPQWRSA
ncbi:3-hydroxyadipyl-CoA dehydrogenase [Pigmentiphaga humi]|uniref:3-hydroxyadipyl-CoA dehydrogenase n=1 Tax=Pigmentiphaga humi TaxID=2478468 RepID=A0A3P4B3B8_9BURK|nr:3-hydroxyacyl-CoA dehydrogenase NAD-binding domain-containing protein [Pigmentiphaga humi]VCU70026.1 3-hydroxyadipyl-CoA dehydrogenase [Pigmentiphaga humi]